MAKKKMNGYKLSEAERKLVAKALDSILDKVPDSRDMTDFETKLTLLNGKMKGWLK